MNIRTRRNITAAMSLMAFCAFADKETESGLTYTNDLEGLVWTYDKLWCRYDHYIPGMDGYHYAEIRSMPTKTDHAKADGRPMRGFDDGLISIPNEVGYGFEDYFEMGTLMMTRYKTQLTVGSIGMKAFEDRRELRAVSLPDGLEIIKMRAFKGCTGLTHITMPKYVRTIGDRAFEGCSRLYSIEFKGNPPEIHGSPFKGVSELCTVYVPKDNICWEKYQGEWQGFRLVFRDKPKKTVDDSQ